MENPEDIAPDDNIRLRRSDKRAIQKQLVMDEVIFGQDFY
jgi:hypothetical protein